MRAAEGQSGPWAGQAVVGCPRPLKEPSGRDRQPRPRLTSFAGIKCSQSHREGGGSQGSWVHPHPDYNAPRYSGWVPSFLSLVGGFVAAAGGGGGGGF